MAFDRNAVYGSRWDAPSSAHPQGAFKNRTNSGSNDGSYLERDWMNDISSLNEALIEAASIPLNGSPDEVGASQAMQGLVEQISGRSYNYAASSILNDYTLIVKTGQYGPASYFDGMLVEFRPPTTNTGAATVNVAGLGIIQVEGTSSGGELFLDVPTQLRYNSFTSKFDIVHGAETGVHVTTTQQNGGVIDQTFEQINFRNSAEPSGPQCNLTYDNSGPFNTTKWTHNGSDTPRFHFYNNQSADPRMVEIEGENPNANLFVYGPVYSINGGSGSPQPIPNTEDFPVDNDVGNGEYTQIIPNKDVNSLVLGQTKFLAFKTQSIISGGTTVTVNFPSAFSSVPSSVVLTPFTINMGSASNSRWAIRSISTTGFVMDQFTGVNMRFNVLVIGLD